MSDAAQPTAAEVRAAAEAVKTALDRHLAAVERRSGEDDPAVYEAFNELAAAAEEYDELLYDRYDEVTPFEIPGTDDALPPYQGPDEANALSVLLRRDYTVVEPQRLLAQAQRVADLEAGGTGGGSSADTVHSALGVLFGEFEPDEISSRHKEFGLEEGDSTLWVTAVDTPAEPGEWLDAPFDQADPHRVVCRFDVSVVFDDELDDDGLDGLDPDVDIDIDPDVPVPLDDTDDVDVADDTEGVDETDGVGDAPDARRAGR
ncbi:hypothetical protein [Streptomyces sp. Je 1-369]|uniref:hypothetical protein n=1 Tax=Streptomyces sp. Je 1-369 TaxID=2966192 RepID=UPI002285CCFA|nr:hypothetical protein [Streptomyces sp. Je 1-369]WAL94525.1 hypothetical protein NOO62_08420 [Streptomyces sp. Je 1-369]